MNRKPLPIGVDDFKILMEDNYYYIDKTDFISELLGYMNSVALITRPRRFGKTLNMSMLKYFFEDERDMDGNKIDNSTLFNGLNISKTPYMTQQGKYPVISISFKDCKADTWEETLRDIKEIISQEFYRHNFIASSGKVDKRLIKKFNAICDNEGDYDLYKNSLKTLTEVLKNYYNERTIILIDEYNVPLENAYKKGFYNEAIPFIRHLFSSGVKSNNSLKFAVFTGCLRVSKESIFTGLNNLRVCSILSKEYSTCFGFTEEEVKQVCDDYNLNDYVDIYKEWYNGYNFFGNHIYNPWSVMNYTQSLSIGDDNTLSHRINSSSNDIIRTMMKLYGGAIGDDIEKLLAGECIETKVVETLTYEDVYKSIENLWTFMLFTGYLTPQSRKATNEYYLKIPNKEIKHCYEEQILNWMKDELKANKNYHILKYLINKQPDKVEQTLNLFLSSSLSFFDSEEKFYHGFALGLCATFEDYRIKSNREAGDGRLDLLLIPKTLTLPYIILEFKIEADINKLSNTAKVALEQIDTKKYENDIIDTTKNIIKYGIAFHQKQCKVLMNEKLLEQNQK